MPLRLTMRAWLSLMAALMMTGCMAAPALGDAKAATSDTRWAADCTLQLVQQPERGLCGAFFAPGPGRHYEASLRTHPLDPQTVLVTWTERAAGDARIWSSLTRDAGGSWVTTQMHDPEVRPPPGGGQPYGFDSIAEFDHQGAPVVFFGGESVSARVPVGPATLYVELSNRMTLARSEDNGQSWTYHAMHDGLDGLLLATDFMDIGVAPDSPHMLVAAHTFRYPPAAAFVATPAGPVGAYVLEAAGTYVWTSADAGKTWSKARQLELPARQYASVPRVTVGPDGLAVITLAHFSGLWSVPDPTSQSHGLFAWVSRDHGRTFEKPTPILDPESYAWFGLGAPVIRRNIEGDLRVDVVLNEADRILLVSSADGRRTWAKPQLIAQGPAQTWNWWSIPAGHGEDGLVVLSQYSNLCETPAPPLRWGMQMHTFSSSGSHTLNLTEEWDRAPTGCFASNDYGGIDIASDGSVWAAWSDPRVSEKQPHIAVARLVSTSLI